jgi:hypothetical protein
LADKPSSKHLIAQTHRRMSPLLGFTRFVYAATTIAGLALVHQMQKKPFTVSAFVLRRRECRMYGRPFSRPERAWQHVSVCLRSGNCTRTIKRSWRALRQAQDYLHESLFVFS